MKKLLSVLFAAVFALTVSGFAFAADNAAVAPKAEKAEKKDEVKKEMAPAPAAPPVKK